MTIKFNNVYINDYYTISGPKEDKKNKYDLSIKDYYYGEKTFELAEIKMQRKVIENILYKNKLLDSNIDLILGGDLINQLSITNMNSSNFHISYLGLYNACATFNESLIVSSSMIDNNQIKNAICITSSHNLTAERQFRFPIEYGANKKIYSSSTSTGSVGALLSNNKSSIKIESGTIGKVVNYGIKDANNMGAIMAPSASLTLFEHLNDLKRSIDYYDVIITGDLGDIGSKLFKEICKKKYNISLKKYIDASTLINNNVNGSGPICLPLILFSNIIKNKKYKKILLLATGSLHSKMMVDQKFELPSITHAISLEVN